MFFGRQLAGILDLFRQLRVMQQGAQGAQGRRFYRGRYPWRRILALAIALPGFALLVPGLAVPFFLAALVRRPLLLRWRVLGLMKIAVIRRVVGNGVVIDARVVTGWCFCRRTVRQLFDLLVVQPGDFLEAIAHQCTQVGPGHFFDQRCSEGGHVRLALERARVGFLGQLLEKVIGQRLCMLVYAGAEGVSAFGAYQGVRVFAFG
ncbi:hypothetical protein D3C77_377000 [compost metagenome]